jgi:hypothetical protein
LLYHKIVSYFTQTLTTLNLEANQIGVQGAQYLSDALHHNKVRQRIPSSLSHPAVSYFAQTLITLNLNYNEVGDQGAKHLSDALWHNKVRQSFFISRSLSSN